MTFVSNRNGGPGAEDIQAERAQANVWMEGRDGLVALDPDWRRSPGLTLTA